MSYFQDNFEFLEKRAEVVRSLGHPIRLAILHILLQNDQLTVTEIHTQLDIEQAVASHHLRILKSADILAATKAGKNTNYQIFNEQIKQLAIQLLGN